MNETIKRQFYELFPNAKELLLKDLDLFNGVLTSDIVNQILDLQNLHISELQVKLLPIAASYHISPISKFAVGAVVLGKSGDLYLGSNIEFTNTGLQFTIHAEQCAIVTAAQHREKAIKSIAVNVPPCGFCRQFINEIDGAETLEMIIAGSIPKPFQYYLPESFSGRDMGIKTGLLKRSVLNYCLADKEIKSELFDAALAAANLSYSPYSRYVAGIAFRTSSNRIISGSYFESAAYNPTITPIQSAIVKARLSGESLSGIQDVVFLQTNNEFCDYRKITLEILDTIAPDSILTMGLILDS